MMKLLNRLNIALAVVVSVATLATCVCAMLAPTLVGGLVCVACGISSLFCWQMCD